jgi:GAF domain-containing protein
VSGWIVDDDARLRTLRAFGILDSASDDRFDAIAADAATLCAAPVALVSLVDRDRQWFKARVGTELTETPIELAICVHALAHGRLLVIPDLAADPRTAGNGLVSREPFVRFYAGVPLVADGQAIGTLCVLDVAPRPDGLSAGERDGLEALAARAMGLIAAA